MTTTPDTAAVPPVPRPPLVSIMRIGYVLDGEEPAEVVIRSKSRIAWDMTRGPRKWPSTQDAPMLWTDFLCWHALKLEGRFDGTFEQFQDRCIATEIQDDAEPVDPTRQDEPAS